MFKRSVWSSFINNFESSQIVKYFGKKVPVCRWVPVYIMTVSSILQKVHESQHSITTLEVTCDVWVYYLILIHYFNFSSVQRLYILNNSGKRTMSPAFFQIRKSILKKNINLKIKLPQIFKNSKKGQFNSYFLQEWFKHIFGACQQPRSGFKFYFDDNNIFIIHLPPHTLHSIPSLNCRLNACLQQQFFYYMDEKTLLFVIFSLNF